MSDKNLYEFKNSKSGNEETGFFNIKGRITRKTFFLRLLFIIILYIISSICYTNGIYGENASRSYIFFETIHLYIFPFFISAFIFIQGIKRMHDINKSGWYFLIPFYNILLILIEGTKGNNEYGIDPAPQPHIQFYDQLPHSSESISELPKSHKGYGFKRPIIFLIVICLVIYILLNSKVNTPIQTESADILDTSYTTDSTSFSDGEQSLPKNDNFKSDNTNKDLDHTGEWATMITSTDRDKIDRVFSIIKSINDNLKQDSYGVSDVPLVKKMINSARLPISTEDIFNFKRVKSIQGGDLGIFIYDYFSCKFREKDGKIFFQKTSGSQRKSGYLYRKDESSFIFLGGSTVNDDPETNYNSENGEAGILYKISNNKMIMLFTYQGNYEILEIIK